MNVSLSLSLSLCDGIPLKGCVWPTSQRVHGSPGVRITHDPFAAGMAEKYGRPGETDNEGFDPYADSVGPGIYGGIVKREADGSVVIGQQYQNHNPRPVRHQY